MSRSTSPSLMPMRHGSRTGCFTRRPKCITTITVSNMRIMLVSRGFGSVFWSMGWAIYGSPSDTVAAGYIECVRGGVVHKRPPRRDPIQTNRRHYDDTAQYRRGARRDCPLSVAGTERVRRPTAEGDDRPDFCPESGSRGISGSAAREDG